jgi:hypothetical protein
MAPQAEPLLEGTLSFLHIVEGISGSLGTLVFLLALVISVLSLVSLILHTKKNCMGTMFIHIFL